MRLRSTPIQIQNFCYYLNNEQAIRRRSDYITGFIAQAIGPNKLKKLTRLIALAHNIRG